MLLTIIELMGVVIFASILQKNYQIPSPVTIMAAVLGCMTLGIGYFSLDITAAQFDVLVLISLPLLITADALKIKWEDLVRHGFSLFWVAVVSVLLSVLVGVFMDRFIFIDYVLPMAAVVMLFCMVSATDLVTVSAIFSNFKLPQKLKLLDEGESLFNYSTALIVFSIALVALQTPEKITVSFIAFKSFSVIFGAVAFGLGFGWIYYFALRLSEDPFVEATIILFFGYVSYIIAEHFHFSGILAVIVTAVIANKFIQKILLVDEVHIEEANKDKNFGLLKYAVTTKDNHCTILKSLDFVGMFVSAILFVSIASVANLEKMMHYKYEILAVFVISTIIRGLMMLKFAVLSNNVNHMHSIQKHWWAVLTFAGSKGALSIVMVHMIPNTFEYKDMFEQIIIGNIMLSTFIYAFVLAGIIMKNKAKFEAECAEDEAH
jgi:CPA1 family monovalent cation:H+ antiporter